MPMCRRKNEETNMEKYYSVLSKIERMMRFGYSEEDATAIVFSTGDYDDELIDDFDY